MESKKEVLAIITIVLAVQYNMVLGGNIPGGKYSEAPNKKVPDTHKFRSRNVIQVWEKAQRMELVDSKMEELKKLLSTHDKKTWQLKKENREGKDISDMEEQLQLKLNQIMQRFGMMRGTKESNAIFNDVNREFEDKRLQKLWKHAQTQDHFDQSELNELKKELLHHQKEVTEYNRLMEDLYGSTEDNFNKVQTKPDKDRMMKDKQMNKDPAMKRATELDLKLKNREINSNYQRLRSKMTPEEERGGLTEPRVVSLWTEAVGGNFTDDELESIKEELQRFEVKIMNYEEVQKQALREEKMYHNLKSRGEKPDVKKHQSLREKAKELGSKIGETVGHWRKALTSGRIHKEL